MDRPRAETSSRVAAVVLVLGWLLPASALRALEPLPSQPRGTPWPTRAWAESDSPAIAEPQALASALNALFAEVGPSGLPDTRALLVVQRGSIVAERYASGFDTDSRFLSWSMAKSVTQALVGILVREGRLDVDRAAPVPEWTEADDPRRAITLRHLLNMRSGLEEPDTTRLLFGDLSRDVARAAASRPLLREPGSDWQYSTASSAILSGVIRRAVGGGRDGTLAFLRRELLDPLGARSLVPEFDAAGTLLGGSSMWATARDWARLGLLFLRDGRWEDRRLLPEGWVDFARAPVADDAPYGGHLWLNRPWPDGTRFIEGAPESAFSFAGAFGQHVVLVPTHDLVVVRLGETQVDDEPAVAAAVGAVIRAFRPLTAGAD